MNIVEATAAGGGLSILDSIIQLFVLLIVIAIPVILFVILSKRNSRIQRIEEKLDRVIESLEEKENNNKK
ncbi:MAG: hypothetical protein LPK00_00355 [Bacillaceae bacterium]|nr:hypothetical protein [Bacillaceae bacterium]